MSIIVNSLCVSEIIRNFAEKFFIMVPNTANLTELFRECKRMYFTENIKTPKLMAFSSKNILAQASYGEEKYKNGVSKRIVIFFSDLYDFPYELLRDIMVHEMIHYYMHLHQIKEEDQHGPKFMAMANEMNEKYGLHIEKTFDASPYYIGKNAPSLLDSVGSFLLTQFQNVLRFGSRLRKHEIVNGHSLR